MIDNKSLALFNDVKIRKLWHNDEWWFSVTDVVAALTDSVNSRDYWYKLKTRMSDEEKVELSTICLQLKLPSSDGKFYETDCSNTEGLFRIIQSIPSPKAEPFKLWLAKVGYERVQEVENPELAQKRMREIYRAKGYSDEWIEKRVRGIAVREELTGEWKNRGVNRELEFAILTNEIAKATFGKTVQEYKEFKKLKKENLRDHMNDLELIFTMLGEKVSTEITKKDDAQGYNEVQIAAQKGVKLQAMQ